MLIDKRSHLDHGLAESHIAWMKEMFADKNAFFIMTVPIPDRLPGLMSGIYGPSAGDQPVEDGECFTAIRMGRPWPSRLIDKPPRPTRLMTVVAGPGDDETSKDLVLYTAYGGPAAPKEPGDFSMGLFCERHKGWLQSVVNRTWEWDDVMDSTWEPGKKDIRHQPVTKYEINWARPDMPNQYCPKCWEKREEIWTSLQFWRAHAISSQDCKLVENSTNPELREWRAKSSLFLSKRYPGKRLTFTCDKCCNNLICEYSYNPVCVEGECISSKHRSLTNG